MQWTDRIRQVKLILVVAAVVIAGASLVVSHYLVRDLAEEERRKMEVWAEAMRSLNTADENTDLNLVLKVIDGNNTIPVIVTDENGMVQTFRNVKLKGETERDSIAMASHLANAWKRAGRVVRIELEEELPEASASGTGAEPDGEAKGADMPDGETSGTVAEPDGKASGTVAKAGTVAGRAYIDVAYDESLMIVRLEYYPYVQLGIVLIFVVIAIFALLTSKKAEQNKVWVGLSKETAHQLGTPISSLMAWTEMLREMYPDDELIPEMDKDVKRLQLIADRFSKIGSLPEPVDTQLREMLSHVVEYMDRRTSQKVVIRDAFSSCEAHVMVNGSLFEWVLENLCKNAVDAMGGEGSITITATEQDGKVILDVEDTGKGIEKRNIKNVFRPGFTTKKRGWGLGLSLAKRIVEEYHQGRIFVLRSEIGVGTTFRIILDVVA